MKTDPKAFDMLFQLALLQGRLEDPFAGIRSLEMAIALQPDNFAVLKNLAVLYERAGLRRIACDSWERALSAAPDEETAARIKEHITSSLL